MTVDLKSGANLAKRKYLVRVVGSALREGADVTVVEGWLLQQGVQNPEEFTAAVQRRERVPKLGALEVKELGGRAAFRELFGLTREADATHRSTSLLPEDFVAYLPDHAYFCIPTREIWKGESIKVHVTSPTDDLDICAWLDRERHVEQLSWCPGRDIFVRDVIIADGGWIPRKGMTVMNLYRPPLPIKGDAALAEPWLTHLKRVYPLDADHLVRWFAHRVQRPWEKINHGIVLGGSTRIGKDTLLVPVRAAVGEWNWAEVTPATLMGRFNGYVKSVILRVNETHDLGEVNRYALYERCKWLLAAPPEVFRVDEKNLREHPVPNVTGVIFTTNHKSDGMFLPPDDARHYVAWSEVRREEFAEDYWRTLYGWYNAGGVGHVVAYLSSPERLEGFDAKKPPSRTEAWHEIVAAGRSPEEGELGELLTRLGDPKVLTLADIFAVSRDGGSPALVEFCEWLRDRKNRRVIPHRLEGCGYVVVRNPDANDGRWSLDGGTAMVYARQDVSAIDRLRAVRARIKGPQREAKVPEIPF